MLNFCIHMVITKKKKASNTIEDRFHPIVQEGLSITPSSTEQHSIYA